MGKTEIFIQKKQELDVLMDQYISIPNRKSRRMRKLSAQILDKIKQIKKWMDKHNGNFV